MSDPTSNQSRLEKLLNAITWSRIVVGALIFFVISICYQACSPIFESSYLQSPTIDVFDYSQIPEQNLRLRLAYPTTTRIGGSDASSYPISVWLWSTQPVTASTQVTYTVAFSTTSNLILLTDKDGSPKVEVEIALNNGRDTPAVIHLQQRSSTFWWFQTISLDVRIVDPTQSDKFLLGSMSIPIEVWSSWSTFIIRFFNLLFGPTLTLASTAIVVIGFAVQQIIERREKLAEQEIERQREREKVELEQKEKEREREERREKLEFEQKEKERTEREQQERQKLGQKLREIENVRDLLKNDKGKAVRRWWDYSQWASGSSGNPDWQKPELQEKLKSLWNDEIKDQGWQLALLTEAIGLFNNSEYPKATERAELIHKVDSADKSNEAIAARFLAAYTGRTKQQIVNVAQEVGADTAVAAIWWLYTSFKDGESKSIVKPVVIQTFAELVGQAETIAEVHKILLGEGKHLLKEPEFGEVLNRFITEDYEPEKKNLARELLTKRRETPYWSPLWPPWLENLRSDDKELNWLREVLGIKFNSNPFKSGKAELDPDFTSYVVDPAVLDSPTGSQRRRCPTILFGDPGSGRTATALLLTDDCQKSRKKVSEGEVFPVYHPLRITSSSRLKSSFYLDTLLKAHGKALIDFLVLNPHRFLDHHENQKSAIAYLLTYCAGSTQNLEVLLRQTDFPNNSTGKDVLKQLLGKSRDAPDNFTVSEQIQLEMLHQARPYGFKHSYILLDISLDSTGPIPKLQAAEQLQPLLELTLPLARGEVYLKLFAPLILKEVLFIPSGITTDVLTWTPNKLKDLLEARLQSTSPNALFDRGTYERELDPADRLIVAAGHSPGRLIHLINQLLKYQADKDSFEKINNETLEAVLDAAAKERAIE